MWAAGHPDVVHLLLTHGADPHAVTASWDVKYIIYAPTTVTLGKTGIPWNTDGEYTSRKGGQNPLFFAVQKHDLESARLLLEAGVDVNQPAADGTTPLLDGALSLGSAQHIFIPGKGAPAQAGSSQTLHADLAMAQFLLDRGAKAKAVDGAGYTPLHGAALAVCECRARPGLPERRRLRRQLRAAESWTCERTASGAKLWNRRLRLSRRSSTTAPIRISRPSIPLPVRREMYGLIPRRPAHRHSTLQRLRAMLRS